LPELKARGRIVKKSQAIKDLEEETANVLKVVTDEHKAKLSRIGDRFASKFERITSISPEDAWARIFSKVDKILRNPEEEEVNVVDILVPIMNRIIYERSSAANMPLQLNLFSKQIGRAHV